MECHEFINAIIRVNNDTLSVCSWHPSYTLDTTEDEFRLALCFMGAKTTPGLTWQSVD
ncbi:hypothetical protein TNCT_499831, partial [Trichonephila clavata]